MNKVHINASKSYDIMIEKGLLSRCGSLIKNVCKAQTICLVTDDTVNALYADTVIQSLQAEGFRTAKFVFAHGEESKNSTTYLHLIDYLAQNHLTRSDAIVALGGGVVGDLSGFAAATFLRGISFIQIPTTLLACVDSSVGGKTAIDIPAGKNLLGAFYQPSLVLCDPLTLRTLPDEIYRDGCAEIIKYAMITDAGFFEQLGQQPVKEWEEEVIKRCVEIKRDVVMQDEYDRGLRALLNFGHTIGHAIEACSHFQISHGHAVAIGMHIITKASEKLGFAEQGCTAALAHILDSYHFPLAIPYSADDLMKAALQDKKREGDSITLIIPNKIGTCSMHAVPTENLFDWIQNGL
ncbi:MAG: 3-dehydroquinate synthase [Clostridiales bacterium]|nr:3-dehydroquinate synthase [Clostridiales bacterium]